MTENQKHSDETAFFNSVEIPYTKSKEEVWNQLIDRMENEKAIPFTPKRKAYFIYSAAAVVLVLLGSGLFFRYYSNTLTAPIGQHITADLPDGSKIWLNASSTITYYPYWWKFSRLIELNGEAFFEVKKGNTFTVRSRNAETQVLGTSFNIYARDDDYDVHCYTGKVKVLTNNRKTQILLPDQSVSIHNQKMVRTDSLENAEDAIAWIINEFRFTGEPLESVFDELERQFAIEIIPINIGNDRYTGNFKRGSSPEQALDLICIPLGLNYKKINQNTYEIKTR